MQPFARNGLTAGQVVSLIRDSEAVAVSAGLQLLDINLNVLTDLTDWFAGGSVGRDNYATLHGTAELHLSTELNWGDAIVRPYMTMTSATATATFNLGAYLCSDPETQAGENPITHQITGYDLLHWLNTPVGESYVVAAGTGYLAAVETILTTQGITQYRIDQDAAATVLPSPKVWAFSDDTTWLNVINDLLAAIGYLGIYSDWDGVLRMERYILPTDRGTEWVYDSDAATSMLALKRKVKHDVFDAPNRWVFYWSKDPSGGAPPVPGAGIYIFQNDSNGPTSVDARGRVISAKPQRIDAVDQAALEATAQLTIDADMRLKTTFEIPAFPNPLHWHFDRLTVADPGLGPTADVLGMSWTLPLDGGDMTHTWSVL
jgi:hypothetical protein